MSEEKDSFYNDNGVADLVKRFEDMLSANSTGYYFDVIEFEEIIDHYLNLGKINRAWRAVQHALKQHPSSTIVQLKNAVILIEKAQPLESLKILKTIEKIEVSNPEVNLTKGLALIRLGKIRDAVREFDRAIQLTGEEKSEIMFNIAMALEQQNHFNTAIKYLMQAYELEPDNLSYIYDIAYCYERTDQLEKALDYYNRFLDIDPFSENVWYNMGVIYNRLEDYRRAIDAYDYAIALDSEYASAYFNKANTLANNDSYESAIEVYGELLFLEDNNEQVICYLGECYEKLEQWDKALEHYSKALIIKPDYADAWIGMGLVMYSQGAYKESLRHIEKALELFPENPEYWYSLGNVRLKLNDFDDAINAYRKAVNFDPQDSDSWINMAETFLVIKSKSNAIITLEEAIRINPGNALFNYRLAAYHLMNSNFEKADHHLRIALSLDYDQHKEFFAYYPRASRNKDIKKLVKAFDSNRL